MEKINVIKFDILGLTTMSSLGELRELTGHKGFDENIAKDKKVLEAFSRGDCDGVFQFEKRTAHNILQQINVDSFDDIVACNSLNRPGPLSLKMQDVYALNKHDSSNIDDTLPYAKYLEKTYGCVLYQEQVQAIAVNIGGLEWTEADKIIKMQRGGTEKAIQAFKENYDNYLKKFEKGAQKHGMSRLQARDIFDKFFNYAFNKGHATGYSLISLEEMYYKVYYPLEFWYVKMKYTKEDGKIAKFKEKAVKDGALLFLPHVNFSADFTLRKVDGERVIQEGLSSLKGVGEKASLEIEAERKAHGIFTSYDNFYDRCKSRVVTTKVISILKEQGALEFDKKTYIKRVVKYNSSLYARALRD